MSEEDISTQYQFIDWIITLPEDESVKYNDEMKRFEEEHKVAYITTAERIGMKKGVQQGMQQGLEFERALILRQLERKFKSIASVYYKKIQEANHQDLMTWAERILEAQTIEEVFLVY